MKTWKNFWFWAGVSWEGHPCELAEFGRAVPTTWNLGRQCVDPATVFDEGYERIQGILAMPKRRRNYHALTTSEVLEFTRWLPYRTREEFTQYRADHQELEPFPLTILMPPIKRTTKEPRKKVVLHRAARFAWSDRGFHDSF